MSLGQLPEEIINTVLSFTETRAILALGRKPNARNMLLEGGPCIVLESILKYGADISSLFKLKEYIPSSIALCKAVLTENIAYIKRICIIWNTRSSNDAFAIACRKNFAWAIQHIRPVKDLTIEQYNRVYFEIGMLDKIDLSVERPFYELINTSNAIKADRLTYNPFRQSLSKYELLFLYILNNKRQEAFDMIEQDQQRRIDLSSIIMCALEEGVYPLALDIYNAYDAAYGTDKTVIIEKLIRLRDLDALEYFQVELIEIHRAIIQRDTETLNKFLLTDRMTTLNIMNVYDPSTLNYYMEIVEDPETLLDGDGYWIGLNEIISAQFNFGYYDYSDDALIQASIDKIKNQEINSINYFPNAYGRHAPPPKIIVTFLEKYGKEVWSSLRNKLYIVPYLTYVDLASTIELIGMMIDLEYNIQEYEREQRFLYLDEKPAVYVYQKTIYHSTNQVDSSKCHLEDDLFTKAEFNDMLFAKDIVIAFKTYADMTS